MEENKFKKFFADLWDKVSMMERDDFFPVNKKADYFDVKSILTYAGIYVAVLIVCAMLFVLLGGIPFIGWLFKFIAIVVGIYAMVGMMLLVFEFMKNN